ncbi:hypothetical protein MSG28_015236 [Choristoneura fumiferana]|uniref:Uncharacterized protein n=1 Tax=Choristoneura fumiferana TaxID=7141 RepID=A0ACC0L000_CHOFU|nr:hypothetical protein MSG28_015236 [Choristoneura fumiferana]
MWGKWDGGCSVRWVDISGVYTQRSCRARHKPAIGRHFVSKRLAKMEWRRAHLLEASRDWLPPLGRPPSTHLGGD